MRGLIIPALLSSFFFIFLIDQVQAAYDRQTPQFLALAILNFCSLVYFCYKFSINTLISYVNNNKSFLFYFVYIIISGISIIIAENKVEAVITYSRYLTYFTTFFIILIIIKAYKFNITNFFFKIIIASVIIESAAVLSEVIDNVIVNGNKFTRSNDYRGFSANINLVAFSLVAKTPVILYYLFEYKSKIKLILLYSLIFTISSSLFFLLTRGAFLAFILITALIFLYKLYKDFNQVFVKTLISLIILFSSFQVSTIIMDSNQSNVIIDRVTSIQLNDSDESINQRLRYSSHAINSISKNPLLGIGIGNWKFISIDYDSKNMQEYIVPSFVHNDFLHIGAEIGILGLIFYMLYIFNPFILLIKKIFNSQETFFDIILLSMISVCLIDSLLNFPVARPISHIFLIFLIVVFEESLIIKKKKSINA
tara:strand:- start:2049 stop:3320 length:1272 start_codon:yes stop_codon:yes gene_type:complete